MRALFLATRLAGTDGVSLEAAKMAVVLRELGFEVAYCAGELDELGPPHRLVPEMHFENPGARALNAAVFGEGPEDGGLEARLLERAARLRVKLQGVVDALRPDLLIVQNAWAIPMQLPLTKGFDFVEIDGRITPAAVKEVRAMLENLARRRSAVEHNVRVAAGHFSYGALRACLRRELEALGL